MTMFSHNPVWNYIIWHFMR